MLCLSKHCGTWTEYVRQTVTISFSSLVKIYLFFVCIYIYIYIYFSFLTHILFCICHALVNKVVCGRGKCLTPCKKGGAYVRGGNVLHCTSRYPICWVLHENVQNLTVSSRDATWKLSQFWIRNSHCREVVTRWNVIAARPISSCGVCLSVCMSVCPSDTFVSCVKTNKRIINFFYHRVATPF